MKRLTVYIILLLSTVNLCTAITPGGSGSDEKVYTAVEQMPQFPGGEKALYRYVDNHIQYPATAVDHDGRPVRVTVQFVVQKDGSVGHIRVIRSRGAAFDQEAIRVIKTLPRFIPGKMNGRHVNVWYTLPVTFTAPK